MIVSDFFGIIENCIVMLYLSKRGETFEVEFT
jgi:hypothetical protein